MALTNFYKGPEAEYSREKHINGIYMSTDSRKLWIFGQPTQELSDIIGFSEVTKKKELFGKIYRSINTEIKNQNFENQITTQKAILISKLSANVTSEENLISSINEKIKNLKL
jgi:hypothetical protein